MAQPARVLVHGATGFTGRLVCAALARRGVPFAVGGRDPRRLEALARATSAVESCVVDIASPESLRAAIAGRAIVCACAGPFAKIGEPVLAACARLGVHYVDTTGEQPFVADAVTRYGATAEASGACVVPAMAYEIAPADWAAHAAAEKIGGAPDEIDIMYATRGFGGAASTSRGTKLSLLGVAADPNARQYVAGTLVHEAAGQVVRSFSLRDGKRLTAASFPSPEAIVVPSHTGARSVRTFMAMGATSARAVHAARRALPALARAVLPLATRAIARSPEGPSGAARDAEFQIVAEARKNGQIAHVFVSGRDPYGTTAEIQAYAVDRALAGDVTARGVVAPSVAFPPSAAFEALAAFGLFAG